MSQAEADEEDILVRVPGQTFAMSGHFISLLCQRRTFISLSRQRNQTSVRAAGGPVCSVSAMLTVQLGLEEALRDRVGWLWRPVVGPFLGINSLDYR